MRGSLEAVSSPKTTIARVSGVITGIFFETIHNLSSAYRKCLSSKTTMYTLVGVAI